MAETLFIRQKKSNNFTMISNEFLQNGNLSMQAIGLFAYILSLPEDWTIRLTEVQKHFTNGRDSFRSAIKELEENGYLAREEVRGEGGKFGGFNFMVFETPNRERKPVNGEPPAETRPLTNTIITNTHEQISSSSVEDRAPWEREDSFTTVQESSTNEILAEISALRKEIASLKTSPKGSSRKKGTSRAKKNTLASQEEIDAYFNTRPATESESTSADRFVDRIVRNQQDLLPTFCISEQHKAGWCYRVIRFIRESGKSTEELDRVTSFLARDKFWAGIILSPEKLSQHFDTLLSKSGMPAGGKKQAIDVYGKPDYSQTW